MVKIAKTKIAEISESDRKEWREIRHTLHQHPELALEEIWTQQFILSKLKSFGFTDEEISLGWATTGVVATVRGDNDPDAFAIGLRADMDALPLTEDCDPSRHHRSLTEGQMHACGHDGHVTMLLGAAKQLKQHPHFRGTVHLIFQPGEEGAGGAKIMIDQGFLQKFPLKAIFGLHGWPNLPAGHFAFSEGAAMASSDSFTIKVEGQGGHAATPHLVSDPMIPAAQLILAMQNLVSRERDPHTPVVLSITKINGGTTFNIIPNEIELCGTLRTLSDEQRELMVVRMRDVCEGVAKMNKNIKVHFEFDRRYPATINTAAETLFCRQVAARLVSENDIQYPMKSSMGGEDFAFFLQKIPGCYARLGTGLDRAPLHNYRHDFNDEVLELGVRYWLQLVYDYRNEK